MTGGLAGLLPVALLSLLPNALGLGYLVPPQQAVLSLILLPISLGAAVLSREVFGIERLLSRGLVALVVWELLVGGFVAVLLASFALAPVTDPIDPVQATFIATAVTAGLFVPVQTWLRGLVERWCFADTYDLTETVQRIGEQITRQRGLDAVAGWTLSAVAETLQVRWAGIRLEPAGQPPAVYTWGAAPPLETFHCCGPVLPPRRSRARSTSASSNDS